MVSTRHPVIERRYVASMVHRWTSYLGHMRGDCPSVFVVGICPRGCIPSRLRGCHFCRGLQGIARPAKQYNTHLFVRCRIRGVAEQLGFCPEHPGIVHTTTAARRWRKKRPDHLFLKGVRLYGRSRYSSFVRPEPISRPMTRSSWAPPGDFPSAQNRPYSQRRTVRRNRGRADDSANAKRVASRAAMSSVLNASSIPATWFR